MAMTSHIVYKTWDAERPATLSPIVIEEVIRGRIGFDGLLMTDDIDMKALSGSAGEKAAAAVAAGCDVALDCWGRMDEMVEIAERLGEISDRSRARLDAAMATRGAGGANIDALIAQRDGLLALAARRFGRSRGVTGTFTFHRRLLMGGRGRQGTRGSGGESGGEGK